MLNINNEDRSLVTLTDRVYYLPHADEVDRPSMGYVKGNTHTLMIEAGNSYKQVGIYLSELDKQRLPHPDIVGVTHWHFDHTYGLSELNALVIACERTNKQLKRMTHWKWDESSMMERVKSFEEPRACQEHIKREYEDLDSIRIRTADIVFDKRLSVDLGGITCELLGVESSHTDDCVLFFIPEDRILFVGDAGYSSSAEIGHRYEKEKLLKFIELLEKLNFDVLVNGHWGHESKESAMADYYEILAEL